MKVTGSKPRIFRQQPNQYRVRTRCQQEKPFKGRHGVSDEPTEQETFYPAKNSCVSLEKFSLYGEISNRFLRPTMSSLKLKSETASCTRVFIRRALRERIIFDKVEKVVVFDKMNR